jgi:hypothetical protein
VKKGDLFVTLDHSITPPHMMMSSRYRELHMLKRESICLVLEDEELTAQEFFQKVFYVECDKMIGYVYQRDLKKL